LDKVIPHKTTSQADVLYIYSQIHLFYMFFRTYYRLDTGNTGVVY